ncbi:metal ABC transporter solute-binding protein [Leuconostoc litchii]|uniref:Metal ABC transporter substrate-binding protein n=1 Tax=Leuconostoc litchii TaxID=1981069 RepID=A0A6P2CJS0_9LACO|nr:metal ABC transporter solute-binding protein [Leuconostoc litchii]TYC46085.1 metal ABC transporter substrate-binding protein [Leuconostoc litchii]
MKKIIIALSAIVLIIIGIAAFKGNSSSSSNQKIQIVASTDFYAEIAKTVVGQHGTATAIIKDSNTSPEDYEPTTTVAKKVSGADIVLANGLGYDTWLNKLAKTSKNAKLIRVGEDVLNKKSGVNPHLWNDPETMVKTANYLASELGKKDPKNRDYYKKNAKKYIASLKPVNNLIAEIAKKSDGQTVAQSEPVFEYMLNALGYKVMDTDFSEAIEEGNDPSPSDLSSLKSAIVNHKIAFFVNNTQTSSSTVSNLINLAKQNDVPVVNVTETIPDGENYVSWKTKELKAIEKAIQ